MRRIRSNARMVAICGGLAFFWSSFLWPGIAAAQLSSSLDDLQTAEEQYSEEPASEQPIAQKPQAFAEDEDLAQACSMAKVDAKAMNSSTPYMIGGFFCGIFGWLLALSSKPKVPAEEIIGKSPDYVLLYTDCYQSEARKSNVRAACNGWLVGASVSLLIWTLRDVSDAKKL